LLWSERGKEIIEGMGNICGSKEPELDLRGNLMRKRSTGADIDDVYDFHERLGQGSMGSVAAIRKKDTNAVYALKTIQLVRISKEMIQELRNEIDILMRLDHPNIIRPLELFERKRQMYFVMEMCSGGDLFERIPYTEKNAAIIINQLLSAIRYLHARDICHRDLKFENVLFETVSPDSMVKLIDFGLSKRYRPGHRMNEAVGTLYSMAPEVLNGNYTQACDMWSIGVISFMLLSGEMPFSGKNEEQVIRKLTSGSYTMKESLWHNVSSEAKDFVSKLIVVKPAGRLTAEQALGHAWVKQEWDKYQRLQSQSSDRKLGESIVSSLQQYGRYGKLRKAALMVIAHRAKPEQISQLRQAFHEFDSGHEGVITLEEMKIALGKYAISEAEVQEIFEGLDVDRTNQISYTEFLAATVEAMGLSREEQLAEAFDRLDSDDSGFISRENLKEILGSAYDANEVERMIAEGDFKQNGQVDYDEFLLLMSQQHEREVDEMAALPPPVGSGKVAPAAEEPLRG